MVIRNFKQGLAEFGWIEGRTIRFETRLAEHQPERMAMLAKEVVALKPDLIFTHGPTLPLIVEATSTIPIVVGVGGNLVASGFAKSLARPGGNVTGMTLFTRELELKLLERLKEAVPAIHRVGVLADAAISTRYDEGLNDAARALGLRVRIERASSSSEVRSALNALKKSRAQALLVANTPMLAQSAHDVSALALELQLPSVSDSPGFANAGGMLQYGADVFEMIRKSAGHADKILRGAKAGELPIEQPTRLEFVVNLRTAKALGLKLPPALLTRADRVIE